MSVKLSLKIVEDEVYSLRQGYQVLKDIIYKLAAENIDNAVLIKIWFENDFETLLKMNSKVESVSDVKTFLGNVIKDHCTFNSEDE